MTAAREPHRSERHAQGALWVAVLAALAQLPDRVLPWSWLAALLLPAILLGSLGPSPRPVRRVLLGAGLQALACWAALSADGPIGRPAILAGTILPPLAFAALRRGPAESALALFLAFCALLTGAILGTSSSWSQAVFVVAAAVHLRSRARIDALLAPRVRRAAASQGRSGLLLPLALGAATAFAAAALHLLAQTLPPPPRPESTTAASRGGTNALANQIGLADDFRLEGQGRLRDPEDEPLVTVRSEDGLPVPTDLYLRSAAFELAGADRWQSGAQRNLEVDTTTRPLQLRSAQSPLRRCEFELDAASRFLVFAPPDLCSLSGIRRLELDPVRESIRQAGTDLRDRRYDAAFLLLPPPPPEQFADGSWARELCQLPTDLDLAPFQRLLAQWQPRGGAFAIARTIADGLAARCSYERKAPTGPYAAALLNFIDGERTGFCMHFAATTALMLRLCGVPCRIAIGVHGGEEGGDPSVRIYGAQHSHAWVEIPMPGRGFVRFDATPVAERSGDAGTRQPETGTQRAPEPEDRGNLLADLVRALLPWLRTPWTWLLALLAAALVPWRRRRDSGALDGAPAAADLRPARRWLLRIQAALQRAGAARPAGVTLERHARALAADGRLPDDLAAAFRAYQEVRFGGRPFDDAREGCMARGLRAAEQLATAPAVSVRS